MNTRANGPDKEPSAPIRVTCDHCGADLLADDRDAGKSGTCPDCGKSLTIPTAIDQELDALPQAAAGPAGRAREERRKLKLKDEIVVEEGETDGGPAQPAPAEEAPATSASVPSAAFPAPGVETAPEGHTSRAKLAGWLRRVIIVVLAFVLIEVFDAACTAVRMTPAVGMHGVVGGIVKAVRAVPGSLRLLAVARPVENVGTFAPLERFVIAVVILVFIARLVVRSKLLDAIYVTTGRWAERTHGGLVYHFVSLLFQAGLLAWAASIVKTEAASDGMACGLLAAYLLVSAVWLITLHLVSADEYRDLASWAITDGVFGLGVFLVVLWPGLTVLWSRAGATAVLCLANSAVALHLGASFIFERRPRGWWWRKPLFLIGSSVIVLLVALFLACTR